MEQILAKAAVAHAGVEILIRRGDDAHVHAYRLLPADAIELALREHAQQPRLQRRRDVADLVEEQRAAVRLLEAPLAPRLRARERAALVAEELRLEEVRRDRRAC